MYRVAMLVSLEIKLYCVQLVINRRFCRVCLKFVYTDDSIVWNKTFV